VIHRTASKDISVLNAWRNASRVTARYTHISENEFPAAQKHKKAKKRSAFNSGRRINIARWTKPKVSIMLPITMSAMIKGPMGVITLCDWEVGFYSGFRYATAKDFLLLSFFWVNANWVFIATGCMGHLFFT